MNIASRIAKLIRKQTELEIEEKNLLEEKKKIDKQIRKDFGKNADLKKICKSLKKKKDKLEASIKNDLEELENEFL